MWPYKKSLVLLGKGNSAPNRLAATLRIQSNPKRLAVEPLENRRLLALVTWVGGSGDWNNPANWSSNPNLPGANDDVTISVPGTITVTHSTGNATMRSLACDENLTLSFGALNVTGGASTVSGQLTLTGGSIGATGGGTTFTASGPASASKTSFYASAGARLQLTALAQYTVTSADHVWQASSAGSRIDLPNLATVVNGAGIGNLYFEAVSGGELNAPLLSTVASEFLEVHAQNANSHIHLNSLASISVSGPADQFHVPNLTVEGGGTVELGPGLTSLSNMRVAVNGNLGLPVGQFTALSRGQVDVTGVTAQFAALTMLTDMELNALAGGQLQFPSLTQPTGVSGILNVTADGAGSRVDFSQLAAITDAAANADLDFSALNDGQIDLSMVSTISCKTLEVSANGANSGVRLNNLASIVTTGTLFALLAVENAGTVELGPGLTSLTNTSIELINSIGLPVGQFTSMTGGMIEVSGVTVSFDALATMTDTRVSALAGGQVLLPSVTAYRIQSNDGILSAGGAGSLLDLSHLTSVTALPAAVGMDLSASDGGRIDLPPGLLTLPQVDLTVTPTGIISGGTLRLTSDSRLMGTGTLNASVINEALVSPGLSREGILTIVGDYAQTAAGTLRMDVNGTSPGLGGHDQLIVQGAVSLDGTLTLINAFGTLAPTPGAILELIDNDMADGIAGQFSGIAEGGFYTLKNVPFSLSYMGDSGNDFVAIERNGVAARQIFYNNSAWDNNNPAANTSDNSAIATDKTALLPGGTAMLANYTSFSKGINGIMIDVANLPSGTITAADFAFKTGNVNDTATWTPLATAPTISRSLNTGLRGSDRVTLIWPDGAITKNWLQVTVLATANTGLTTPDVFYFGNAIGEAGNSAIDAQVNAADELAARGNPRNIANPAPITFLYDYNRDKQVNAADQLVARGNPTNLATRLLLITPTPGAALLDEPAVAPAPAALADAALVAFGDVADPLARRSSKR